MKARKSSEQLEQAELAKMRPQVHEADKAEEAAWGIKTDKTAFGKKKIEVPDRW